MNTPNINALLSGANATQKANNFKAITDCQFCNNTGRRIVPNGEDDYNIEICDCYYGREFEKEFNEAESEYQKLFGSSMHLSINI